MKAAPPDEKVKVWERLTRCCQGCSDPPNPPGKASTVLQFLGNTGFVQKIRQFHTYVKFALNRPLLLADDRSQVKGSCSHLCRRVREVPRCKKSWKFVLLFFCFCNKNPGHLEHWAWLSTMITSCPPSASTLSSTSTVLDLTGLSVPMSRSAETVSPSPPSRLPCYVFCICTLAK